MGNGSVTMQTQMVSSVLGVRVEDIESVESDTDLVPYNLADYGSRGVYVEGSAAKKVAETMKQKLAEKASNFLDCVTDEIEFADRSVFVKNDPERKLTLGELIEKTQRRMRKNLASESYHSSAGPSQTAYILRRYGGTQIFTSQGGKLFAVHDVGKVITRAGIEVRLRRCSRWGSDTHYMRCIVDETGRMITVI